MWENVLTVTIYITSSVQFVGGVEVLSKLREQSPQYSNFLRERGRMTRRELTLTTTRETQTSFCKNMMYAEGFLLIRNNRDYVTRRNTRRVLLS